MEGNPSNITPKSNVSLAGISVDKILQRVNRTEKYLEDFYKRTKRNIEDCRVDIQECDSNHLPMLEIDKELEEFLKQDHYPVQLIYAESEDVEYESDFEYEDTDSRQTSNESDIEEDIKKDSPDQVAGKRKPGDCLTGAESLHGTGIKAGSVIPSSDEAPEHSIKSRKSGKQNERKTPTITKGSKHRPTTLQDLTERSQYTHAKMEELVFSCPELKNHLFEGKPISTATMVHQKIPQYDAQVDALDLRQFEISGISGIGALWSEKTLKVILGCTTKVICLEKSKSQITKKWEITIDKAATDVVCVKSMAYVCVQDEGRIFLVDINGKVENENVLQGILQCRPHKVSVYGDTLLVKSFEESIWKNIVFEKQSALYP